MNELQREATDPKTSPLRLQELAEQYTALRPLIALNPSTYPGLVQWLEGLDDPAVKVALSQRRAAQASSSGGNVQPARVSVYKRPSGDADPKSPLNGVKTTDAGAPPLPLNDDVPPVSAENTANSGNPTGTSGPTGSSGAGSEPPRQPAPQPGHAKTGPPVVGGTAAKPLPDSYQVHPTVRADSVPPQESGDDRRRLVVIVLLLVLIAATLVFAVVYLFRPVDRPAGGSDEPGAPVDEEPAGEDSGANGEPGGDGLGGDENPDVELFPAPDGSLSFNHFMAPSGNIACELGEERATCTVMSHEFRDPTLSTCGTGPLSVTLTDEKAYLDCGVAPVNTTGASTLSYSDYSSAGQFACLSTMNGMTCWNTVTGASFAVARQGYVVGKEPIEETGFPWTQ